LPEPPVKLEYATPASPDPLDRDTVLNAGCLVSLYGLLLNILALIAMFNGRGFDLIWRVIGSPRSVLPLQDDCFSLFAPTVQWLAIGLLLGAASRRHWAMLFKVLMGLHYAAIPVALWRSPWHARPISTLGFVALLVVVLVYLAGQIVIWSVFRSYSRRA
jgi:hypothetical protein